MKKYYIEPLPTFKKTISVPNPASTEDYQSVKKSNTLKESPKKCFGQIPKQIQIAKDWPNRQKANRKSHQGSQNAQKTGSISRISNRSISKSKYVAKGTMGDHQLDEQNIPQEKIDISDLSQKVKILKNSLKTKIGIENLSPDNLKKRSVFFIKSFKSELSVGMKNSRREILSGDKKKKKAFFKSSCDGLSGLNKKLTRRRKSKRKVKKKEKKSGKKLRQLRSNKKFKLSTAENSRTIMKIIDSAKRGFKGLHKSSVVDPVDDEKMSRYNSQKAYYLSNVHSKSPDFSKRKTYLERIVRKSVMNKKYNIKMMRKQHTTKGKIKYAGISPKRRKKNLSKTTRFHNIYGNSPNMRSSLNPNFLNKTFKSKNNSSQKVKRNIQLSSSLTFNDISREAKEMKSSKHLRKTDNTIIEEIKEKKRNSHDNSIKTVEWVRSPPNLDKKSSSSKCKADLQKVKDNNWELDRMLKKMNPASRGQYLSCELQRSGLEHPSFCTKIDELSSKDSAIDAVGILQQTIKSQNEFIRMMMEKMEKLKNWEDLLAENQVLRR